MGCKKRGGFEPELNKVDALLFTTMCIIGFPVDVYVKDGSVYTGVFHTARVDDDYAIVLKRAKMIKKGGLQANVPSGSLVETLVILSEDLVQVVAKGVMLSADSIPGHFNGDSIGAISSNISSLEHPKKELKATISNELLKERQVRDSLKDKLSDNREYNEPLRGRTIFEVQGSSSNLEVLVTQTNSIKNVDNKEKLEQTSHGVSCGSPPSTIKPDHQNNEKINHEQQILGKTPRLGPTSSGVPVTPVPRISSTSAPADLVPPRSSNHNASTKESKLNPGAKIFAPSTLQHRTVTPPVMPTVSYVPDSCPVVPVVTEEPAVEITHLAPPPSVPVKFVPYNDVVPGHGGLDVQYAQPTIGYMGSRTQPARSAAQYHHLQAATGYVHPNSQNVMVGRLGPLVYVHPFSHDVVQSTVGFPQVSSRPLLIPHPVHPPKHQGIMPAQPLQLYMTPPDIAGIQQPFPMPSIPITHTSFPIMRPVQVPGSNGFLPNKQGRLNGIETKARALGPII